MVVKTDTEFGVSIQREDIQGEKKDDERRRRDNVIAWANGPGHRLIGMASFEGAE
jgi:hypothetical protein